MSSAADEYWASFFGVSKNTLLTPGVVVVPHEMLKGYNGAWLFQHKQSVIVSVPTVSSEFADRVSHVDSKIAISADTAKKLFGHSSVDRVIGPAFQGFLERMTSQLPVDNRVRRITIRDDAEFERFKKTCSAAEFDESSVDLDNQDVFALFIEGQIVSASSIRIEDDAALLGVICSPKYRGKGYAKAVVSVAAERALAGNLPVRYQALVSNKASVGLGTSIGAHEFGKSIAVRFKAP